jgi:hypothetical protein
MSLLIEKTISATTWFSTYKPTLFPDGSTSGKTLEIEKQLCSRLMKEGKDIALVYASKRSFVWTEVQDEAGRFKIISGFHRKEAVAFYLCQEAVDENEQIDLARPYIEEEKPEADA